MIFLTYFLFSSPSERTADDLEIIYEELLHIKALSHLSTTVSFLSYVVIWPPVVTVQTVILLMFPVAEKTCSALQTLLSHI